MSLQVWLPLNGSLNNQGLNNLKTASIQNGVSIDNNGKIGKCYTNSGTIANIPTTVNLTLSQFTICAWVKYNSSSSAWQRAFGLVGNTSNDKIGFCTEHSNGTSLGFHFTIDKSGVNTAIFDVYSSKINVGQWVHYAMMYSGSKYYIYENGALVSTGNASVVNATIDIKELRLFGGISSYSSKCSLNDVRIYDHCLSQKEIKEISKGLALHYKLDNVMESTMRNLYNSPQSHGYIGTGTLNEDGSYNVNWSYTGTGSDSWWSTRLPAFSFTAGKTYMWMCKVKVNSCTSNVNLTMRCSRMDNDWTCPNSKQVVNSSLVGKGWQEYYAMATLQATSDRSGTTYTTVPKMEFYTNSRKTSGEVFSMNFDIKDVMVCETSSYVPYIDNSLCSNEISDCSGYGHNGTKVGSIITVANSPRYENGYYIDINSHILAPITIRPLDQITYSVWTNNSNIQTGNWENGGGGLYYSGGWAFQLYINGAYKSVKETTATPTSTSTWHMVTGTYDGRYVKIYVDGELKGSTDVGGNYPITYHATAPWCINGNPNGSGSTISSKTDASWSDYRIYSTALSAEDIKELYQTSASVDNKGNLYCYKLKEV